MEFFGALALFFLGFFILIRGADFLVRGTVRIAHLFGASPWFIGMVIVGIGTSIPELSITVASVFDGTDIGVGTVIGSDIFNFFIIGVLALLAPIVIQRAWGKDFTVNALAVAAFGALALFPVLGDPSYIGITRSEGVFLIVLTVLWIASLFRPALPSLEVVERRTFAYVSALGLTLAGFVGVFFGGDWVVSGAETLALLFHASPALIGLIVVGIGTSLPELIVSATAAFKGQAGLAVGNLIGSNIFNVLGVIGVAAAVHPVQFNMRFIPDLTALAGASVLLAAAVLFFGRREHAISRLEGTLFILVYLAYFAFTLWRG